MIREVASRLGEHGWHAVLCLWPGFTKHAAVTAPTKPSPNTLSSFGKQSRNNGNCNSTVNLDIDSNQVSDITFSAAPRPSSFLQAGERVADYYIHPAQAGYPEIETLRQSTARIICRKDVVRTWAERQKGFEYLAGSAGGALVDIVGG